MFPFSAAAEETNEGKPAFWPEYEVPKVNDDAQNWFDLGVSLYNIGNYKEALILFKKTQTSAAHHSPSLIYLNACVLKLNESAIGEQGHRIALELVEFPGVKLENASLDELFDYLQRRVTEITNNEFSIFIVFKGSERQRHDSKVSFELKQGPLQGLLDYIVRLSNCQSSIEHHAIVITPSALSN